MSEKEKQIVESPAEALKVLPEAKRERLLGFAEGMAAATADKQTQKAAQ